MQFYQFIFILSAAIAVFVSADCDSEETLRQCISYVTQYKATNCKGANDFECICAWDSQLATCFSVCADDDSIKGMMDAAIANAKSSCDRFKKEAEKAPKGNYTSTESSSSDDVITSTYESKTETSTPVLSGERNYPEGKNNTRAGRITSEVKPNSAMSYTSSLMGLFACIVFTIASAAI
ncbi:hypothetical protein AYI68_g1814 [Smittium mucronatum]|uniref:Extracellular membrane protein CFEM domain-containing protein n=1 Tax=Smittium mucronatum TaxID=133383 RepID=A0A1R0H4G2_9FUNG|nr:hypothetical protein AYI68_g1814 [Smittium mucronatum]